LGTTEEVIFELIYIDKVLSIMLCRLVYDVINLSCNDGL